MRYPMAIRYDFFCVPFFFFFFFRFLFSRNLRLFHTWNTWHSLQSAATIREVSEEAKSRGGEWSRKELSDCRHLRDGLSLINGSNIPPYTDDPGIGDTILVIYKHRSSYVCMCVRARGGCFCFYSIRNRRGKNFLS